MFLYIHIAFPIVYIMILRRWGMQSQTILNFPFLLKVGEMSSTFEVVDK